MESLHQIATDLANKWARKLVPHFGPSGSMDLDLKDWPEAEGPSYYNQFSHYTFLFLATGRVAGCTLGEQTTYKQLAIRNLEYILDITSSDFHTPHYSRGRNWGRHVGEWLNYYLLCSLMLMEEHTWGSPALRRRLSESIQGATHFLHQRFETRFRETPKVFPGNHATWHALLFFQAGLYFKRPDWVEYGRDFFHRCVLPFQHSDGYWPEGDGIVVNYGMVTAQAVSLYAGLSGDIQARSCVGRFLGFYLYNSLPDGSSAVILDVRMRYHPTPFLFIPPGFLDWPEGRALIMRQLNASKAWLQNNTPIDNGAQAFAFFGSFLEACLTNSSRDQAASFPLPRTLPAARLTKGPWHAYLGWQITPEHPSRFILDTQNFLEIWHRNAGYLIGTGGSKFMPRFSTVRRLNAGRAYVPDKAHCVHSDETSAQVRFHFESDIIAVRLSITEESGCTIQAWLEQVAEDHAYEFSVVLALKHQETLSFAQKPTKIDPSRFLEFRTGSDESGSLVWRGLEWQLPSESTFTYPVIPYNSYTQDGLPRSTQYTGRISFRISQTRKFIKIQHWNGNQILY